MDSIIGNGVFILRATAGNGSSSILQMCNVIITADGDFVELVK